MQNEEAGKGPDRKPAGEESSTAGKKASGAGEESPTAKVVEAAEPSEKSGEPAPGAKKTPAKPSSKPPMPADRRKLLRWGVVGLAVLVALIAWIATRGGGESSSEPEATAPAEAVSRIVTPAELTTAAAELGQPIYWAGPMAGKQLELRELGEGQGAQVVYLPEGAEAGQDSPDALTIGSYPLADPKSAVEGYAGRAGSHVLHSSEGREVVTSDQAPTSAYFAAPDNSVQVEVYDPSTKRALTLALSAQVKPAE